MNRQYQRYPLDEVIIEDETRRSGRKVNVTVDTLNSITIQFGKSFTLRTDESGAQAMIDVLNEAIKKSNHVRFLDACFSVVGMGSDLPPDPEEHH